jgi:hypothetical protein
MNYPMKAFSMRFLIVVLCLIVGGMQVRAQGPTPNRLSIYPTEISTGSAREFQRIVVQAHYEDGSCIDVTDKCSFEVQPKNIGRLEAEAFVPQEDGKGVLEIKLDALGSVIPVVVSNAKTQPPVTFRNEVLQVLTKSGCNTGKCHGAATGKDGFRLSLFGYDPKGDFDRITKELSGRRINRNAPEESLLIQKAIGFVAHTGGGPIAEKSKEHELLIQWLHEGALDDHPKNSVANGIEVLPGQSVGAAPGGVQKMIVMASFNDGSRRDVTDLSTFFSNNEGVANVDKEGLVSMLAPGVSLVMARFDQFSAGSEIIVRSGEAFEFPSIVSYGAIDRLVDERLQFLHIQPSQLGTDEQFLRRVFVDLVGQLPSESDYSEFIGDSSLDKRSRWVDRLLDRNEFQDQWALHWAELLQIRTNNGVSRKALRLYDNWLREQVAQGKTIADIAKQTIAASGSTLSNPATNYFQTETTPQLIAENVAQVFLGTRIQCAQCHNHPFDRWRMDDYYDFASFFSQIGYKQGKDPRELTIYNAATGSIVHPLGKEGMRPRFLGAIEPIQADQRDLREHLAEWLTHPSNRAFSRNIANVVWSHFFGRGIVEPVDDVRISNPASNDPLLDYLADRLVAEDFDIKPLVREICNSRTYQASTTTNSTNRLDEREFSHQKVRRLKAEVLLDCICQVTEAPEKLPGLSKGERAVKVADGQAQHYFLNTFGRSNRNLACTCETKVSPTLSQALHLLNGETTNRKIEEGSVITTWIEQKVDPREILRRITTRCLTRQPTESELSWLDDQLRRDSNIEQSLQDFFWAILNSNEFIFNH